jgi:hypothetical protein
VVKYGQKITQIKVLYFLKSQLLKPMKLKRNPTTASEVPFEPQKLKYLLQKMTVSLKFISKF